jgi:hypothetical protein
MGWKNRYSTTDVSLIPEGSTKWLIDYGTTSDFYMYKGFTLSWKYSDQTGSHKASFTIVNGGYFPGSKVATAQMGQFTFI